MDSYALVWPFELGIRTLGWGTGVNRSTVFSLHCFVMPCVPNMMQGVGLLDSTLGVSTKVYFAFLFPTLPCPVLTYGSCAHFHLLREQGFSFAWGPTQRGHLNGSYIMHEICEVGYLGSPSPLSQSHGLCVRIQWPPSSVTCLWW